MIISPRDISDLTALLSDVACDEVTVETARQRWVLRRLEGDEWVQETTVLSDPIPLSRPDTPPAQPRPSAPIHSEDGRVDICAPLPGTFYRAPKPGAPPFVKEGLRVSPDTVVGIIETMKLMNSVPSGISGEIVEICAANGTQVEAQDVIMRVLPERRP